MATATSLASTGRKNAFDTIAASTTDSSLVAAVSNRKIRVHAFFVSCGGTASTVQFNTKPGTAGTAIGPVLNNSLSAPEIDSGWFETNLGEGLSVSTGAGSNTAVTVVYSVVLP